MTLAIRQIVFAARDLEKTVSEFSRALGIRVAYRDPQVAEFGLKNALLPIGDQFLEVVSPVASDTAAGRHLDRHGDSAYMLILQTDDLDGDRIRLDRLGVRVIWQASYPDIRAVHLHPKDVGAAIVSLDQPSPPESWRWAGQDWRNFVSKAGARQVLGATIGARDPAAMARRWSEVLGTKAPTDGSIELSGSTLSFVKAEADLIVEYRIAAGDSGAGPSEQTICGTQFRIS
jgi:hypothetical protein